MFYNRDKRKVKKMGNWMPSQCFIEYVQLWWSTKALLYILSWQLIHSEGQKKIQIRVVTFSPFWSVDERNLHWMSLKSGHYLSIVIKPTIVFIWYLRLRNNRKNAVKKMFNGAILCLNREFILQLEMTANYVTIR